MNISKENNKKVLIIGAGPAGLATAYSLSVKHGIKCVIFEKSPNIGGLCETVEHHGYHMDIGPHRFFTKNSAVSQLWNEVLGDEFTLCDRQTRIYYNNIFFNYPLKPIEIPLKLGILKTIIVGMSYIKRHIFPIRPELSFKSWVKNRFGDKLYDIFFHDYTKKVWGIDPENINADWAAQRIKSLSLGKVILDMLKIFGKSKQTSLISQFHYPRMGAGQMYSAMADKIRESGSEIICNADVKEIKIVDGVAKQVVVEQNNKKSTKISTKSYDADFLISSMPLDELIVAVDSAKEAERKAASNLTYRSLVTVNLMFDATIPVTDHWIYLNSPDVKAGRMNLFQNWSKSMMPSGEHSLISLEYFCNETDPEWSASDKSMYDMAVEDINKIDFMKGIVPVDHKIVRYHKSYPCYFGDYMKNLNVLKDHVNSISNLIPVGRYGQFRYNNMDHSIETGFLAARVVMGEKLNVWAVNEDAEYHEEH